MTSSSTHNNLFKPVKWKAKTLPSRVVLAPINTAFTISGRPSYRLVRFHSQRSGTAIGISMVGNVAIETSNRTNDRTAVLRSWSDVSRFSVLARAISREGSLAGIQLASAPPDLAPSRQWVIHNRSAELTRLRQIVLGFTDKQIADQLTSFVRSGRLASLAQYDVVQIHAAHGYLLSLLLHPATNTRTGRFAFNSKWLENFIAEFRSALGNSLCSIRLSTITGLVPADEEINSVREVALRAAVNGVDIIDLSAGFYTVNRKLIYPGLESTAPVYSHWLRQLTSTLPCLVAIVGRISLQEIGDLISPNVLISIGRALIADPQFATKTRDGRADEINQCLLKNKCHYFSRGVDSMECGVNPNL